VTSGQDRLLAPRWAGEAAERPSIAVAITAYDIAHLLPRAIRSALEQTDPPDEVIIVDDGSNDDTLSAVRPFLDRVTFVQQPNRGPAGAKDSAARAGTADWIVFLDGDDVWLPGRIAAIRRVATHRPDLSIITTDALEDHGGEVVGSYYERCAFEIDIEDPRLSILRENFVFSHAAVRRAPWEAAGGFDDGLRGADDRDCWTRMIFDGARVGIILEPSAIYHRRAESVSRDRSAAFRGRAATMSKVLERDDLSPDERELAARSLQDNLAQTHMYETRQAIESGQPARVAAYRLLRQGGATRSARFGALVALASPSMARGLLRARGRRPRAREHRSSHERPLEEERCT
jgi:glycosyltransferase involved in cell wall biosynthesis